MTLTLDQLTAYRTSLESHKLPRISLYSLTSRISSISLPNQNYIVSRVAFFAKIILIAITSVVNTFLIPYYYFKQRNITIYNAAIEQEQSLVLHAIQTLSSQAAMAPKEPGLKNPVLKIALNIILYLGMKNLISRLPGSGFLNKSIQFGAEIILGSFIGTLVSKIHFPEHAPK